MLSSNQALAAEMESLQSSRTLIEGDMEASKTDASTCKTGDKINTIKKGVRATFLIFLIALGHLHALRAHMAHPPRARTKGPHGGASYVQMGRRGRIARH